MRQGWDWNMAPKCRENQPSVSLSLTPSDLELQTPSISLDIWCKGRAGPRREQMSSSQEDLQKPKRGGARLPRHSNVLLYRASYKNFESALGLVLPILVIILISRGDIR
jgi:hypothetical protein